MPTTHQEYYPDHILGAQALNKLPQEILFDSYERHKRSQSVVSIPRLSFWDRLAVGMPWATRGWCVTPGEERNGDTEHPRLTALALEELTAKS